MLLYNEGFVRVLCDDVGLNNANLLTNTETITF